MSWRILQGDASERLRDLAAGSVQTCVTSPPYFGLRNYGHEGQLGLEETPAKYVATLVDVFRELKRVLRDDGTCWINLGDSYASNGPRGDTRSGFNERYFGTGQPGKQAETAGQLPPNTIPSGLKPKDLVGIPWMVAFALRDDGWYLRSDIIWSKPNPMPESVTDRPTKAHEYIFLLSKSARYFYDADAVREAPSEAFHSDRHPGVSIADYSADSGRNDGGKHQGLAGFGVDAAGRNKRSVWTVSTQPYSEAHFATFPPKLIEPCILAGSSPKACGVVERTLARVEKDGDYGRPHDDSLSTVLDPFCGSGTTGMVALRHDRSFIGIELNPKYVEMARNRIKDDAPLLNTHLEAA